VLKCPVHPRLLLYTIHSPLCTLYFGLVTWHYAQCSPPPARGTPLALSWAACGRFQRPLLCSPAPVHPLAFPWAACGVLCACSVRSSRGSSSSARTRRGCAARASSSSSASSGPSQPSSPRGATASDGTPPGPRAPSHSHSHSQMTSCQPPDYTVVSKYTSFLLRTETSGSSRSQSQSQSQSFQRQMTNCQPLSYISLFRQHSTVVQYCI